MRNYCFRARSLALVMLKVWAERGGEVDQEGIKTGFQVSSRVIGFMKTLTQIEFGV